MPCGKSSSPVPKLLTSVPPASNFRIDGRFDPAHELLPQRSATQMLRPSLSISTALVDPHSRPSGSVKLLAIVRYGFGRLLVGTPLLWPTCPAEAVGEGGSSGAPTRR